MSTYSGHRLTLTIFGKSHGPEIGMVLEGIPAGQQVDIAALREFLQRRAPGGIACGTSRREPDEPTFTEGLEDGFTDGTPIRAVISNTDVRSADYREILDVPRPGHADYTSYLKYGTVEPGGGAFSGRMTAPLCVAGGIALQMLKQKGISVFSHIASVGTVEDSPFSAIAPVAPEADGFPVLCAEKGEEMLRSIAAAQADGDSLGGTVECAVTGFPGGIGGELFDGLEGRLSLLLFSIPAVKGVEFGSGFSGSRLRGSENNDEFLTQGGIVQTATNRCGGILGGISDGMPLIFRVAVKPTPSISKTQRSVSLRTGEARELQIRGRHDACIVPRALPCVEACTALALLDALLDEDDFSL